MTFNLIQTNRNGVFSGTTITVSPTSPFSGGDAVLIAYDLQPNTLSVSTIADGTNTYIIGLQTASGGGTKVGYAYALNLAAGTPTITLTVTGGTIAAGTMWIEEWSGIVTADGAGNAAFTAGTGSAGQAFNSGSFTLSVNNELAWGWGISGQGTALNAGSGFTAGFSDVPTGYLSEYQVAPAGPISASFTTASSGAVSLFAVGAAFQGPPPPIPPLGVATCEW